MTDKTDLNALAVQLLEQRVNKRIIIAIAGPPGSGKTTAATELVSKLNTSRDSCAAMLSMDGYHYDNSVLRQMGRLERKGAPDTFDVDGLAHMLGRIRENTAETIAVPKFDRHIEVARAGAYLIPRSCNYVVIEGNYLLLDIPPWDRLAEFFDITLMIKTPIKTLRDRLNRRWQQHGYGSRVSMHKIESNDLPNGLLVTGFSRPPDLILESL